MESLSLEKTSNIIKSNRHPNTTVPVKPCPEYAISCPQMHTCAPLVLTVFYPPLCWYNTPWGKASHVCETIVLFDSSAMCSSMIHLDTTHLCDVQLTYMIQCDAAHLFVIHCATQLIFRWQIYTYMW